MINNIRELRTKANMTQKELGEKTGISERTIGHYENSKRQIRLETAVIIAEALGATLEELIQTEEGNENEPKR